MVKLLSGNCASPRYCILSELTQATKRMVWGGKRRCAHSLDQFMLELGGVAGRDMVAGIHAKPL